MEELIKKQRDEGAEKNFKKMRWDCLCCKLSGREDYCKRLPEFGVNSPEEFKSRILEHGAWTRCNACLAEIKAEYGRTFGHWG